MDKSLGMALIAEEIETPRQLALLHTYGCDEAQGCQPMDAEQIGPLLSSKRHKPVQSVAKSTH
jgi:EAL domain-containing protein (putative c-di-GMP-specific phosphodiesterase class I)